LPGPGISIRFVLSGRRVIVPKRVWWLLFVLIADVSAQAPVDAPIWRGNVSAGASAAAGNTESRSINVGVDAARTTPRNKLSLTLTSLYGTIEDATNGERTVSVTRSTGKFDFNLSPATFGFVSLDLENDKLQNLNLRSVAATGLGYKLIQGLATTLEIFGGLTHNREEFSTLTRSSGELVLGNEFSQRTSEWTQVKQRFAVYPNLTERGEYRAQFDASLVTMMWEDVGLKISVSDRYQSNPLPGVKQNDLLFLTSVIVAFGPQ
jgi:putative salt-induced outer membrane protein YdiY